MTDMLKVVARAIAGICNEKGQELASKYEAQAPPIPWQAFEREAKAAIEAMRSPTDEMKSAGDSMMPQFADGVILVTGYDVAGEVWTAMADAALEGK